MKGGIIVSCYTHHAQMGCTEEGNDDFWEQVASMMETVPRTRKFVNYEAENI